MATKYWFAHLLVLEDWGYLRTVRLHNGWGSQEWFTHLFCKRGASPAMKFWWRVSVREGVWEYALQSCAYRNCHEQIHNLCVHGSRVDSLTIDIACTTEHILNTDQDILCFSLLFTYLVQHSIWWYIVRHSPQRETLAVHWETHKHLAEIIYPGGLTYYWRYTRTPLSGR